MVEKVELLLRPPWKRLGAHKISDFVDLAGLALPHEGLSYPAKTTIQLTIFREQAFSLENPANFRALLAYFLHLPYFGKIATVPTETLPSCRKLRKPPKALSLGTSPLFH
ncbi:hypothetical protein Pyn_14990 [Prunus yedoensis var. nudiflora]|uniref:Uncharacterized protein n=1 Tax=Prunus yedoensis var. nudiflora TaxID=2094558 RepID=A0A314ZT30_PRUYE|nr:hypothetical protein Pyn_14990 [Prunus yedoensis var. nudiflora]